MEELNAAYDEGAMLILTSHPYVIGPRSRMKHLDRVVSLMKLRPGVWFAGCGTHRRLRDATGRMGREAS